jgi:hypothetical protein
LGANADAVACDAAGRGGRRQMTDPASSDSVRA